MTKPTRLPEVTAMPAAEQGCPFRWRGNCAAGHFAGGADTNAEARYRQVRRQGIYLAACIVDDVASLGIGCPDAMIDEIRRRICELVRCELKTSSAE